MTVRVAQLSPIVSLVVVTGGILLVFPSVWIGRKAVEVNPTVARLAWITSGVHFVSMLLFGTSIIVAINYFQVERGIRMPIPLDVGSPLMYVTGFILMLTVLNLALSGFGAPFAIALSKRIADRWMHRWTRNPMVVCTLATLLAAGFYAQSLFFVLLAALFVTPAWIYFLKEYEERELEIRFGASYLECKARTSFLWLRRPSENVASPINDR